MEISRTIDGLRTAGLEGRYLLKPNLAAHYPTAIRGEGLYLFDSEGRRYFAGSSGAVTANLGHGRGWIGEVMAKQAETVAFTFRNQLSNEPAERLAVKLCQFGREPFRIREPRGPDVTWTNPPNQGADIHAFCTDAS
jgi:acetylornithine/succinyldiaminopimelate/putrescine aminotransferase